MIAFCLRVWPSKRTTLKLQAGWLWFASSIFDCFISSHFFAWFAYVGRTCLLICWLVCCPVCALHPLSLLLQVAGYVSHTDPKSIVARFKTLSFLVRWSLYILRSIVKHIIKSIYALSQQLIYAGFLVTWAFLPSSPTALQLLPARSPSTLSRASAWQISGWSPRRPWRPPGRDVGRFG